MKRQELTTGQQVFQLLGATAENERIATLEPDHPLTLVGEIGEQFIDLRLGQAVAASRLADIMPGARQWDKAQQLRADQAVVDHRIGLHQQAPGTQRQQARVTGAGADQSDFARSEGGLQRRG
jgi:ABC-type glutathione transport system ATPase component